MNLRLEAILKKEKNLYKDITSNLKGKNFAELNGGLAETIAKLLERKALIEQLNQEVLEDEAREALYKRIEDNNKYFAEEVDREDINKQFMQADDSYAKSAEWQNLHMAFLSTASVASYKAVDTFNDNLKDLRNRREEIREGLKLTKASIAKANSIDPTTNRDNAKDKFNEYTEERKKLEAAYKEKKNAHWEATKALYSEYKEYESLIPALEKANKGLEAYQKIQEDLKNDPEYKALIATPEDFDKLINKQKELLQKMEEEKTKAIKNASGGLKIYFDATYTKEEAEKLEFLDKFKMQLDMFAQNDVDKIKELCGAYVDGRENSLMNIYQDLVKRTGPSYKNSEKTAAYADDFIKMTIKFDDLNREFDPEMYTKDMFSQDTAEYFNLKEAREVVSKMINQINTQLDARKAEIFNTLSEEEKNLISPSQETIDTEKRIKDNIKKIETAKEKRIHRTEAELNKAYNQLINRKIEEGIKEGLYKDIKGIPDKDLEKTNGDEYLKNEVKYYKDKIATCEANKKKYEDGYKKYLAAEAAFKPTADEYNKKRAEYTKKIDHAKKMMNPTWNFDFHKYKEALDKNCKDVPKLDLKALMEQKQVAGFALYQMTEEYKGNHNDSPEFAAMKASMAYVMNWGTDNALPLTYPNAPQTFEDAITQLKENCKKYVEAKNDQKRPFPSKMRHLRFQIAKAFDMYADTQRESLKGFQMTEELADKWNMYFEVKSQEKDELEQKNEWGIPNVQTDIKKEELYKDEFYKDDPVLESEEMGNAR